MFEDLVGCNVCIDENTGDTLSILYDYFFLLSRVASCNSKKFQVDTIRFNRCKHRLVSCAHKRESKSRQVRDGPFRGVRPGHESMSSLRHLAEKYQPVICLRRNV